MDLIELIKNRKSERKYAPGTIPHEIIRRIIECARWAPSACNLQLTEYIVVDDKDKIIELSSRVSSKFKWAETYLVLIYDSRFSKKRYSAEISLGAAMENILLAAHAENIVACPMTGFENDAEIKRILMIPKFFNVGLIISLGYPQSVDFKKMRLRRPLEQLLHYGEFGTTRFLNDQTDIDKWSVGDVIDYRQRLAPVYLYNNHFQLNVYSNSIYKKAVDVFEGVVGNFFETKNRLVDFCSYDGTFINNLFDRYNFLQITAADYIDYTLEVIKQRNGDVATALIDEANRLSLPDACCDTVTFVHKAEFTPNLSGFFIEAYRLLKKDGVLFVTTAKSDPAMWFFHKLLNFYLKYLRHEVVNSYENNKFYKIGAYKMRRPAVLNHSAMSAGFKCVESGYENVAAGIRSHKFYWALYKK